MADFTVPGTWTYDGSANANQSTYKVSGHTSVENYLVIFDRKPLTVVNGIFSKPSVSVRIIRSFVDSDGAPFSQKAVARFTLDWPAAAAAADIKAMVDLMGDVLSDAEIASDFVDDLDIPRG
jgi:hypothetical protein